MFLDDAWIANYGTLNGTCLVEPFLKDQIDMINTSGKSQTDKQFLVDPLRSLFPHLQMTHFQNVLFDPLRMRSRSWPQMSLRKNDNN